MGRTVFLRCCSCLMIAELTTSSGRMNGGASTLPASEKARGKPKLTLVELVAPVSDDLLLLNDNLQKVSTCFCSDPCLEIWSPCVFVTYMFSSLQYP